MATPTTITAPKAPIFIGTVQIKGQSYDVAQHPEFVRFFFDLMRRLGGPNGMSISELIAELRSIQAGEMLSQPMPVQMAFPDVLQGAGMAEQFADVMQGATGDCIGFETTLQTF